MDTDECKSGINFQITDVDLGRQKQPASYLHTKMLRDERPLPGFVSYILQLHNINHRLIYIQVVIRRLRPAGNE
jgi:hypothetical protein